LKIGRNVTVGHKVILHGCTVEDDTLIGMGAVVMDGVVIKSNVLLGAGSLVPPGKVLESGHLWLGSPVRKVRPLTQKELDWIAYSAGHYVKLKNDYLNPP
jgi:carbonic anhydrase/acetyltransferase-like protein (isoleucine patch superfamily)